jgi:isoleucyl-tRNA synthetase
MSTVLENRPPFRAVLGFATLRDEKGQPMHKSLGNSIDFNEAADRAGADVMRWIFCQQNPAVNLNFGWKLTEETKRRLLKLWESYKFFVLYARPEAWRPDTGEPPPAARSELDRWLLSRLQTLIRTVRDRLDDLDAMNAARAIEDFFEELSNWYIRRSRTRFWAPGTKADPAALATLHTALVTVAKLIAPFLPFLAEELYQNLVREIDPRAPQSVHHCAFPEAETALYDPDLEPLMELTRRVASLGNAARKGAGIKSRQPLPAVRVAGGSRFTELPAWASSLVVEELNVKRVEYARELSEAVRVKAEANPKLLGPKYGRDYPRLRTALQSGEFRVLEDGRVAVGEVTLEPGEVSLSLEPAPGYAAAADAGILVVLDTTHTPELVSEGRAREIVRLIQDARKRAALDVSDRIRVRYEATNGIAEAIEQHAGYIRRETLATQLAPGLDAAADWVRAEDEIDGMQVVVALQREHAA